MVVRLASQAHSRSARRMSSGRKNCDGIVVVDWVPRWGSRLQKPTTKTRGHTRLRQVWDSGFFVGECGGRWPRHTASRWGPRSMVSWRRTPARCVVCVPRIQDAKGCCVLVSHSPWGSRRPQGRTTEENYLKQTSAAGSWGAHRTHTTRSKSILRSRHQTQVSDPPQGADLTHLKPLRSNPTHARHSTEENPRRKPHQPQPPHRFLWWEHVIKACSFSRSEAREKAPHDHAHHTGGFDSPTAVRPDTNVTQRKGGFK